jgi:hypothetical protein
VVAAARRRSPAAIAGFGFGAGGPAVFPDVRAQGLQQGQLDPAGDAHPHHVQAPGRRPPCRRWHPPWPRVPAAAGSPTTSRLAEPALTSAASSLRGLGQIAWRSRETGGCGCLAWWGWRRGHGATACRCRGPAQRPAFNRRRDSAEEGEDVVDHGPTRQMHSQQPRQSVKRVT